MNAGSAAGVNGAPPATATAEAKPVVETKEVVISVEPPDAKVTRDGADLGALPTSVHLKGGETAILDVTRAGYKPQTVTLDGSQPRMLVRMEHVASKPGKPAAKPAPQSGTPAVGDFQDPFLKK